MPLLFIDKCLDTVSYVLLQVVVEEAVIVQVIRLRTEQVCGIGRDGVELGLRLSPRVQPELRRGGGNDGNL